VLGSLAALPVAVPPLLGACPALLAGADEGAGVADCDRCRPEPPDLGLGGSDLGGLPLEAGGLLPARPPAAPAVGVACAPALAVEVRPERRGGGLSPAVASGGCAASAGGCAASAGGSGVCPLRRPVLALPSAIAGSLEGHLESPGLSASMVPASQYHMGRLRPRGLSPCAKPTSARQRGVRQASAPPPQRHFCAESFCWQTSARLASHELKKETLAPCSTGAGLHPPAPSARLLQLRLIKLSLPLARYSRASELAPSPDHPKIPLTLGLARLVALQTPNHLSKRTSRLLCTSGEGQSTAAQAGEGLGVRRHTRHHSTLPSQGRRDGQSGSQTPKYNLKQKKGGRACAAGLVQRAGAEAKGPQREIETLLAAALRPPAVHARRE
jgi:hypothetical protein